MSLIKFTLFIYGAFFIFDRATRSFLNPYKLIMVFGKKGSGKTTYLTKTAIKEMKRGHRVYSTIPVPGTYLFNPNQLGLRDFIPNSVLLIDEAGILFDNRNFKSFPPHVRDFFKLQRHYKLKVYLFSQCFDIDSKLRDLTDEMYLLTNFGRVFSVQRRIIKTITIQHASEGKASCLVDDYRFASLLSPSSIKFTFIPRYIDFFDSYDVEPKEQIKTVTQGMTLEQTKLLDDKYFLFKTINQLKIHFYTSLLCLVKTARKVIKDRAVHGFCVAKKIKSEVLDLLSRSDKSDSDFF